MGKEGTWEPGKIGRWEKNGSFKADTGVPCFVVLVIKFLVVTILNLFRISIFEFRIFLVSYTCKSRICIIFTHPTHTFSLILIPKPFHIHTIHRLTSSLFCPFSFNTDFKEPEKTKPVFNVHPKADSLNKLIYQCFYLFFSEPGNTYHLFHREII
jgi:hypothetical protein